MLVVVVKEVIVALMSDDKLGSWNWSIIKYLRLSHHNKDVYTAILVACGWAGAVMNLCKPQNSKI